MTVLTTTPNTRFTIAVAVAELARRQSSDPAVRSQRPSQDILGLSTAVLKAKAGKRAPRKSAPVEAVAVTVPAAPMGFASTPAAPVAPVVVPGYVAGAVAILRSAAPFEGTQPGYVLGAKAIVAKAIANGILA